MRAVSPDVESDTTAAITTCRILLRGNFHQGSDRFLPQSRGKQCTANAVVAISVSEILPLTEWTCTTIDQILDYGDGLYRKSLTSRPMPQLNGRDDVSLLTVYEVHRKFVIEKTVFDVDFREDSELFGLTSGQPEFGHTLLEALSLVERKSVFTSRGMSIALMKNAFNTISIFDSHSRDENGKVNADGKACLLHFYEIESLTEHLLQLFGENQPFSLIAPEMRFRRRYGRLNSSYEVLTIFQNPVLLNDDLSDSLMTDVPAKRKNNTLLGKIGSPDPEPISLGDMDSECSFCDALFFRNELQNCCSKGKVSVPLNSVYPDLLKSLLTNCHPKSKSFLKNIRRYNTLLSFASTQVNLRQGLDRGAPVVVVSGQIHHTIGNIDLNRPKFGSLYFLHAAEATAIRIENSVSNDCDAGLLEQLDELLRSSHPFAQLYQNLGQVVSEHGADEVANFGLYFHQQPKTDRRVYAAPSNANEVGAVFQSRDGEFPIPGQVKLFVRQGGGTTILPKLLPIVDALCYPLIFPFGELSWDYRNVDRRAGGVRKRVSKREFDVYRLMERKGKFNPILNCGLLTQQYIVDKYVDLEGDRLHFNRVNQKLLRVENYVGLQDYVRRRNAGENAERIGRIVVLPSTFTCGPRFMQQNYQDAMAIVIKYGKPTFFITFTCNPRWPEIRDRLKPNQNAQDRPDLICRVFEQKRKLLMKDILVKKIFGAVLGYVDVIEFQKRGLPHMHLVVFLCDDDKIRDPEKIDHFISAELPPRGTKLHDDVVEFMLHGPCGDRDPNSPCMEDGECSKRYPKNFVPHTKSDGAFVEYRRRDNGCSGEIVRRNRSLKIDSRDVVPYNPYLLMKFRSHINVEFCNNVKMIKYLFKYIYKGPDSAIVEVRNELALDEIQAFIDSRYVSSCEASWRLLNFSVHDQSHSVVRLPVHLPGERTVHFEENGEQRALENSKLSMLEAFFQLNSRDIYARQYVYAEIPLYYRFHRSRNSWIRRIRSLQLISRMYTVSPKYVEKFHLRILLLHVRGPQSFDDLLTLDGRRFDTFQESARARGLTASDDEWDRTLEDASKQKMPQQIRKLFAFLLCFCTVGNPRFLWDKYKWSMIEDYMRRGYFDTDAETYALRMIDRILRNLGTSVLSFHLPIIDIDGPIPDDSVDHDNQQRDDNVNVGILNAEQLGIFNTIIHCVEKDEFDQRYFFLRGSGGVGKTFLYNMILARLRELQIDALAVAFTGIAALLLKNGRTAHSTFRLPLDLHADSRSSIKAQSDQAAMLKKAKLIVWDEITMTSYHALDVVDRLLRDLCMNNRPFGGKCVVLGGDEKQLLPVAAGQVKQTELFFTNSSLWRYFTVLNLTINMRTDASEIEFSRLLSKVGEGVRDSSQSFVNLPKECLSDDLIHDIFGKVDEIDIENTRELAGRAILCTKNASCNDINREILQSFPGNVFTIFSVDSIQTEDDQDVTNYPEEFLNSITPSGMPLYELCLKIGVPVVLLRNLSLADGLINGTRLIVQAITATVLTAEIVTGVFAGQTVLIPKIDLVSTDPTFPFTMQRRQFPVKLCFALTINKAQGQTFDKVGIYLGDPVFSHGQLYVAMSRVRNLRSLKVQTKKRGSSKSVIAFAKNVVFPNILKMITGNGGG